MKNKLVKVARNGERFWVQLVGRTDSPDEYYGYVRSEVLMNPENFGDKIIFHATEVLDVMEEDKISMH